MRWRAEIRRRQQSPKRVKGLIDKYSTLSESMAGTESDLRSISAKLAVAERLLLSHGAKPCSKGTAPYSPLFMRKLKRSREPAHLSANLDIIRLRKNHISLMGRTYMRLHKTRGPQVTISLSELHIIQSSISEPFRPAMFLKRRVLPAASIAVLCAAACFSYVFHPNMATRVYSTFVGGAVGALAAAGYFITRSLSDRREVRKAAEKDFESELKQINAAVEKMSSALNSSMKQCKRGLDKLIFMLMQGAPEDVVRRAQKELAAAS